MAYNDEALKAKLSTLNETQDSIVSVSQWITFHKRHADRIASYWLTRLRDAPPPKRLNFIYLVNDIVQNARARKRPEFPDAFSPLMAEAVVTAYRSSTPEIQNKIRRVVEVWRTRNVWEAGIQTAIEGRLDEVDKTKSSSGKKTLGGSLFNTTPLDNSSGGSVPTEISTLPSLQIEVTKAVLAVNPAVATAQSEYGKLNDPEIVLPPPPVHAARLSSLMKALATAESSLTTSVKARKALIADFERLLSVNKSALEKDETTLVDLTQKRTATESQKRDVEDAIMRGLAADPGAGSIGDDLAGNMGGGNGANDDNQDRPEVEELTPEPESFSPPDIEGYEPHQPDAFQIQEVPPATIDDQQQDYSNNPSLKGLLAGFSSSTTQPQTGSPEGNTNILAGRVRQASDSFEAQNYIGNGSGDPANGQNGNNNISATANKRRKATHSTGSDQGHNFDTSHSGGYVPDLGEMGIDINEFSPSNPAHAASGFDNGSLSTSTAVGQAEDFDVLGSLEGDVDALIRSQGT